MTISGAILIAILICLALGIVVLHVGCIYQTFFARKPVGPFGYLFLRPTFLWTLWIMLLFPIAAGLFLPRGFWRYSDTLCFFYMLAQLFAALLPYPIAKAEAAFYNRHEDLVAGLAPNKYWVDSVVFPILCRVKGGDLGSGTFSHSFNSALQSVKARLSGPRHPHPAPLKRSS